jgi:hypothetical protein
MKIVQVTCSFLPFPSTHSLILYLVIFPIISILSYSHYLFPHLTIFPYSFSCSLSFSFSFIFQFVFIFLSIFIIPFFHFFHFPLFFSKISCKSFYFPYISYFPHFFPYFTRSIIYFRDFILFTMAYLGPGWRVGDIS